MLSVYWSFDQQSTIFSDFINTLCTQLQINSVIFYEYVNNEIPKLTDTSLFLPVQYQDMENIPLATIQPKPLKIMI